MKYTYEVFYAGKRMTIVNDGGTFKAQQEAARIWKVSAKKQHMISVVLAAKDDAPVVHVAVD